MEAQYLGAEEYVNWWRGRNSPGENELKEWKQPECPSMDAWIKKGWYLRIMDYYPAIKIMKFFYF